MDVLFIDLNMKALNSLIWASAVLAKLGLFTLMMGLILYAILFVIAILD